MLGLLPMLFACHRIHWQRNKVRVRTHAEASSEQYVTKPSISIRVNNRSPYIFSPEFTDELKLICEKEFERLGYEPMQGDATDYLANIRIEIDSFPVTGVYVFGKGGPSSFWKPYRKEKVYAIVFDYELIDNKYKSIRWKESNDIYYFDDPERNTRRSKSMVKYTIRYGS